MGHFFGSVEGSRGETHRLGTRASGLSTTAAGWGGAISVEITHDEKTDKDLFLVRQHTWRGEGVSEIIAEGVVGEKSR